MFETADAFVVVANLPGYRSEEIELEATDQMLRIVAERDPEQEEGLQPLQIERMTRAERVITLPFTVDIDEANATCEDGVCRITLPKAEEGRRHRIGVH